MMPRSRARLARLVLAFAVVMVVTPLATALAADETVVISTTLEPKELTVSPGTTVIWVNEDSEEHRMRSDDGPEKFDSGNLGPGESYTFNFALEGSYPYIDDRNEDDTAYHGTITVAADAPPPGDPGDPPPPAPTSGDVSIVDRSFQPASLTVAAGATVTWANNDNDEHTVTATDSSWDSGIFGQGGTYSKTFAASGTYNYFCIIHPDMTGTITVSGSTGEPPPPPPPPAPEPDPTPPPPAAPGNVNIVDFAFDPVTLTVTAGATVTWANAGAAPHTVTANSALFDSGLLFAGDSYQRTFATPGTYAYLCSLHPEMTATIVVNGAGGEPAPPGEPPPSGDPAAPPAGGGSTAAPAGGIAIVDNAFSPASKSITTGTTLAWTNTGAVPHTVTSNAGGFDSGIMLSGDTYRRTFTQPGTFDYLCTIHPSMTGTVTVTGSPTGPAPPDELGGKGPLPDGGEVASSTGPSSVGIFDNGYTPGTTTVSAGQTVSWANTGALPHTVTARDASFDSGILMSGDGYSRRFTTPGSYEYFCSIHPEMVATVVVTEATGPIEEGSAEDVVTASDDAAANEASDGSATVIGRNVQVVDNDFVPGDVTVEAGQAVRWTNAGAIPHTVTAQDGAYDSGILNPGDAFEQVFAEVGLFEYLCTLHPDMVGTVEVVPAQAEALTAGVGGAEPPGAAVAIILAGAIVAAAAVFAFGMARLVRIAGQER